MSTFKSIRRRDRGLTESQAREILKRAEHGVLATVGPDGWPYAVPVNHVVLDNVVYIHCAQVGHKLENIAHDGRVSYCAVASARVRPADVTTSYESAIVFGRAAVVTDPVEKRRALEALVVRFCGELTAETDHQLQAVGPRTAVVRIRPEHITGKSNRER